MRILIAALALLAIPFLAQAQTMSEPSTPTTPPADSTTVTTTGYPGGRWQPPPARYGAGATNDTSITLKDGTRLAATVAFPVDSRSGARAAGPFPVIVEFSPYLGLGQRVGAIPYFVERGYIYAVVRPRGTGGSSGQMQQFTSQDGRDGAAVVDWAAALESADGRVAMAGCSYPAATALATAAAVRPGSPLKVVVSSCIGLDMQHRQVWTSNGLPNGALGAYAPRAGAMMGEQPSVTGYFADFLKGVMAGGPEAYDGYWQDRLPLSRAADIVANGIPVLLWTGWSDINEIGGIHAYHALQNAAAGRPVDAPMDTARTDPRWQIIVGDWSHAQGLDVGVYLQWFETWLKGIDTGITPTKTPMHVYEMGTGRWLNLAGYPVVRTSTRLQFGPGGTLAEAMPASDGSAQLRWGSPEASDGSVAFTSNPFADGATIAGPISATIYAASSNTNLELIANLYDVAPNGEAQRISIGALLGSQSRLDPKRSWRDDAGTMTWPWPLLLRDEYLQADRMQRFDLFLALRQWGLAPGHRVRLVLTTQSPASVCPPEGAPAFVSEPCRLTAPQQATLPGGVYRIGFGKDQPSSLNLPLLAYRAFETVRSGPTPTGWDETNRRMAPATTTLPLDWGRMVAAPLRSEAQEMNQSPVEAGPPAGTSALYPGGKWSPGPARFGVEVVEDVPVTMDDGVVLNASIAYPTDLASGRRARGPFPVVIEHMPYVQFAVPVRVNPFFAEHGYISVQVRARGLGKSGGEVQFLSPREGLDGKAIIEWAAHRLEGSDGRVGLIGCSWPGAIAMTDVAAVGPGSPLKAAVAACSGMENMHRQSWLNAGLPTMSFWQFAELGPQLTGDSPAGRRFFKRFADSVLSGGDMAHDADYWRARGRATLARSIVDNGVPMLLWAGWGDVLETGTVRAYVALQNAHAQRPLESPMEPGQPITPRYQLIMGGWEHGQGLDMGVFLQWMDTWVKGVDTGIQNTPAPMHLFEPGSDRWINLTGYPVVQHSTRWNLGARGQLQPASTDAPASRDELRYGEPGAPGAKLTYTSAPLEQGATIAGPMSVTLHASSSNTNLVFIGRLYDVAPDASAALISRGALLGSQHRLDEAKSWRDATGTLTWPWPLLARDEYLTPDRDYRFELALAPRQWGLRPGHRLRLELTTQTPVDRCPASGLPPLNDSDPCRLTRPQAQTVPGGVYAIGLGGAAPSTLNLPMLPYRHFPAVPAAILPHPWNEGQRAVGGPHAEPFALPLHWGEEGREAAPASTTSASRQPRRGETP